MIQEANHRLKRSINPYNWEGKTVYVYKDLENGAVLVSESPNFDHVFDVKKEDITLVKKTVKPIAQFSETRGKENKIYLTLRNVFLENHTNCEANLPGCKKVANQVHHAGGRVGKRLIDVNMFMAFCGSCHTWVNEHPEDAIEMGLAVNRI